MKQSPNGFARQGDVTLWVLATSVGWALVPFTALDPEFRTYAEIARQLPMYCFVGLLLGLTTGLLQAVVWKLLGMPAARWWWATTLGYGLALPLSLIVFTLILSMFLMLRGQNPLFLPMTEPAGTQLYPLPGSMALWGGVVGAAQWLAMRRLLPRATRAMALLWVFGAWLSVSLGLTFGALARQWQMGLAWQGLAPGLIGRAVAGAASGLFSSLLVIFLMREGQRIPKSKAGAAAQLP
jgi:hypothetical protein